MAVLNSVSFEDAVDLINRKFEKALEPIEGSMRESGFVIVESVPANSGGTRRHKEALQSEQYASRKTEGGQVVKTRVQQGYYKDTTSKTFSKSVDITYEMRKLGKYSEIRNAMDFIANVCPMRIDLDLSMHISYGTATSYTNQDGDTVDISVGDGLAPFSASHTLTGSATTYRNKLANSPQFSEGALELMEDLARTEIYNNLGEQMACEFDILFTTDKPQLVNAVRRLLQSTAQVSAANAGVSNVYRAKYNHVILRRIDMSASGAKDSTKANYWGLASSKYATFHLDVYGEPEMRTPAVGNNGEDPETLDWTFTVVDMHDSAIVTGRGLLISLGDGTA